MNDSYDIFDVITVIKILSRSTDFYSILLDEILHAREYDDNTFNEFKTIVEQMHFKTPSDVVLFFEN